MKSLLLFCLLLPSALHAQNCLAQIDKSTGNMIFTGSVNLPSAQLKSPVLSFQKNGKQFFMGFFSFLTIPGDNIAINKMVTVLRFNNGKSQKFKANKNSKLIKLGSQQSIVFESTIGKGQLKYFNNNKVSQIQFKFNDSENATYNAIVDDNLARMIVKSLECLKN